MSTMPWDRYAAAQPAQGPWEKYAQGADVPPVDDRNAVQKFVDNLTTVTPKQEEATRNISSVYPQVGEVANIAQKFGAGAIQGLTSPFVHPLDTLQGIGQTIALQGIERMHERRR